MRPGKNERSRLGLGFRTSWSNRRITLLLFAFSILGISALISLLPNLEMNLGSLLVLSGRETIRLPSGAISPGASEFINFLFLVFRLLVFALLPISIIYFVVSSDARRKVLYQFIFVVANILVLMILLPRIRPQELPESTPLPAAESTPSYSPEEFQVSDIQTPPWFVLTAGGLLLVLVGAAAWRIINRSQPPDLPGQIAKQARRTLDDLDRGTLFQNAILQCYHEMTRLIKSSKKLDRQAHMTPREFTLELERHGLHNQHIARLTQLFERARYGAVEYSAEEEQEARSCLAAIAFHYGTP